MSPLVVELLRASRAELLARLRAGGELRPEALEGHLFHGVSLGLPAWLERLTWKKFAKGFHRDGEIVRGWNVRIAQTPLDDPRWDPKEKRGVPVTFGHFEVLPARGARVPHGVEQGVLLDYGRGKNGLFDPTRLVKDPVVARARAGDVLLGWSYVALGPLRLGTPSFFTLERGPRLTHVPRPPRG